jgi:glycosyl transferase family 25
MKAYVINLRRSPERRESMTEQLAGTKLDFEFVDGVDGRALSQSEQAELVSEATRARHPGWLTGGRIGCALSHHRVYERIEDEVALVLEDDVRLSPTIADLCARVASEMHGREIVLLYFRSFEVCRFSSLDAVKLDGGARLLYPMDPNRPNASSAYLITRQASQRLAEVMLPLQGQIDNWGYFYDRGEIESLRCVLPRPVGVRNRLPSTKSRMDYSSAKSPRERARVFIRRSPVATPLLTINRIRIERQMTRTAVVPERSPIALSRARTHP